MACRPTNFALIESKDCVLLPNKELQCPHAKRGLSCNPEKDHPAFTGCYKIVFRGLSGHVAAIQQVYTKLASLYDELAPLPRESRAFHDKVVTMVWQNQSSEQKVSEDEIKLAQKISKIDTAGVIFPRYLHHFSITGAGRDRASVRKDYVNIYEELFRRYNIMDPDDLFHQYRKILQHQFLREDSSAATSVLNLMWQEYAGKRIGKVIAETFDDIAGDAFANAVTAMLEGLNALLDNYDKVFAAHAIAHMDIHTGNLLGLVSRNTEGAVDKMHFRLVDFGYSTHDVWEFVKNGSLVRRHDPIEYRMMLYALHAINTPAVHSKDHMVTVKDGKKWKQRPVSEMSTKNVWILYKHFEDLKSEEHLFTELHFGVLDLYAHIFSELEYTLSSLKFKVPSDSTPIKLDKVILRDFQVQLYDITSKASLRQKTRQCYDKYSLHRICITTTSNLLKRNKQAELPNVRTALQNYQLDLVQRLPGFFEFYLINMLKNEDFPSLNEEYGQNKIYQHLQMGGALVMDLLAESPDASTRLFTCNVVYESGCLELYEDMCEDCIILNFVDKNDQSIFACVVWWLVTGAWFQPGTSQVFLMDEFDEFWVLDLEQKRCRKHPHDKDTGPTKTDVRNASRGTPEVKTLWIARKSIVRIPDRHFLEVPQSMRLLATSQDGSMSLYKEFSSLNFTNRAKESMLYCRLHGEEAVKARFNPGTFECLLMDKHGALYVLDFGNKRYRRHTGASDAVPVPENFQRPPEQGTAGMEEELEIPTDSQVIDFYSDPFPRYIQ